MQNSFCFFFRGQVLFFWGLEKEKEPCNSNGLETGTWCIGRRGRAKVHERNVASLHDWKLSLVAFLMPEDIVLREITKDSTTGGVSAR